MLKDIKWDELRLQGDSLFDPFLLSLSSEKRKHTYLVLKGEVPGIQFFPECYKHWQSYFSTVDEIKLARGQAVFEKYHFDIMLILGLYSLPYCYAGTPGNKVLYLSEKMRSKPAMRLQETAQFVSAVGKRGSFDRGGEGWDAVFRTRLSHALVRYHLGHNKEWKEEWGLPVNQEDMAGTNLAFSYLVLQGLRKLGYSLSDREKEDFLYLWKVTGYLLGINSALLSDSYKDCFGMTQIIKKRNFTHTNEGEVLTRELIQYYEQVVPADKSYFLKGQMKLFLGEEVADYLGIKPNPFQFAFAEAANGWKYFINQLGIEINTPIVPTKSRTFSSSQLS